MRCDSGHSWEFCSSFLKNTRFRKLFFRSVVSTVPLSAKRSKILISALIKTEAHHSLRSLWQIPNLGHISGTLIFLRESAKRLRANTAVLPKFIILTFFKQKTAAPRIKFDFGIERCQRLWALWCMPSFLGPWYYSTW